MIKYEKEEVLKLTKVIHVTDEVFDLLKKKKANLRKKNIKMSVAKLACNAIIEKYGLS